MQKQAPTLGRILVMAIFTLSCFGLLLYLWSAFGGPVPLKPHGYRFNVSFAEATQLAQEADVRISGVNVGKVKKIDLGGRAAPTPTSSSTTSSPPRTRAILRQKTLLGETYVEFTPGTEARRHIPEDGRLETAQVAPTVELDEIFRAFDNQTREGFQVWQGPREGHRGSRRGLLGLARVAAGVREQHRQGAGDPELPVARDEAAGPRHRQGLPGAHRARERVRDLIRGVQPVVRDDSPQGTGYRRLRAFPEFITQSQLTLRDLAAYADNTTPLMRQLRPSGPSSATCCRTWTRSRPTSTSSSSG